MEDRRKILIVDDEVLIRNFLAEALKRRNLEITTAEDGNQAAVILKEKTFDLILQSSPIRLRVETVKEITPSQELLFEVELASNSNQTLENVMVVADYPFGFALEL